MSALRLENVKPRNCIICRDEFLQFRSFQKTCNDPVCKLEEKRQRELKKAAKLEKRVRAERKKELKPLRDLIREAQRHVNRYIRLSKPKVCISCGSPKANYAGHYRTTKAAPNLRFTHDNIWPQCFACNVPLSGNIAEYRPRLIALIGLARVEALENDNAQHKWTREEVIEIGRTYRRKCRELERV